VPDPYPETGSQSESGHDRVAAVLGTTLLAFGVIIFCLAIAEASEGLSLSLPRSWYTNRPLWYLLALGCFAGAWNLLRRGSAEAEEFADRTEPRFERVVLYTRAGCHLCDEMKLVLERHRRHFPAIEEVDVDTDPALVAKFNDCVPVLEIDGKVRFRGRLNEILLRRLIDAAPAKSPLPSNRPESA